MPCDCTSKCPRDNVRHSAIPIGVNPPVWPGASRYGNPHPGRENPPGNLPVQPWPCTKISQTTFSCYCFARRHTAGVCDAWLLWVQCLWMVDVVYLGIYPLPNIHISSREILPMVVWVAWFDRDFGVGRLKMDVVISRTGYPPGPRFWNRAFC